jgi:hypothetical protein
MELTGAMETFDVILILGAACGVVMILGGVYLFSSGARGLTQASHDRSLSPEFARRLKALTQYPALSLIVFGLTLPSTAAYVAYRNVSQRIFKPIEIRATASNQDIRVTACLIGGPWPVPSAGASGVSGRVVPDPGEMYVRLIAPNFEPTQIPISRAAIREGRVDLGVIDTLLIASPFPPQEIPDAQLIDLPTNVRPEPLSPCSL